MGDYEGTITYLTVMLRGHALTQIAKVQIYICEKELQAFGFPSKQNSSSLGIEGDFAPSFHKGVIVEV